jgi:hypothetical protein
MNGVLTPSKLTAKAVQARLPKAVMLKLKAEFPADVLASLSIVAISAAPEDADRAAVRLLQVCGRVPSAADLEVIFASPASDEAAAPASLPVS